MRESSAANDEGQLIDGTCEVSRRSAVASASAAVTPHMNSAASVATVITRKNLIGTGGDEDECRCTGDGNNSIVVSAMSKLWCCRRCFFDSCENQINDDREYLSKVFRKGATLQHDDECSWCRIASNFL